MTIHFLPAPSSARLGPGEVQLWCARLNPPGPRERALLSTEEWIRAERFHFVRDTDRFVAGRALLRNLLARELEIDPRQLRLRAGKHGKPELDHPETLLRFNLSHSGDLMLVALSHAREIGVDLEAMRDDVPFEMLSDHYFEPEDAWSIRTLRAREKAAKFYEVWTRTEARLKASGAGFSRGFHVPSPERWSLVSLMPADGYAAAVAVEGHDYKLHCWAWPN